MKVLVIDTSILCLWLGVPDMDGPCGPEDDKWDRDRVNEKIAIEEREGTLFVLPLAVIIETGNHITHAKGDVFPYVNSFADFIEKTADGETPWAAFTQQNGLWDCNGLKVLANHWRTTASSRLSLGDVSIIEVAEFYAQLGKDVEILCADSGLKAYEPSKSIYKPRRRR